LSPDPFGGENEEAAAAGAAAAAAGGEVEAEQEINDINNDNDNDNDSASVSTPTSLERLAALAEALRSRNAGLICRCNRALCEPGATAARSGGGSSSSSPSGGLGRKLSVAALYLLRAGSNGAALLVQRIAAADEVVPVSRFVFC